MGASIQPVCGLAPSSPRCRRFAFLKLLTLEGVQQLMERGVEYAQRMHDQGVWAARLGLGLVPAGAGPSRMKAVA